jgi:hypothetical protein
MSLRVADRNGGLPRKAFATGQVVMVMAVDLVVVMVVLG